MSTAVLTDRLEPAQHTAAKVAGFIYLFTMVPCSAICGSSRASFLEDWLLGKSEYAALAQAPWDAASARAMAKHLRRIHERMRN